MKTEMDYKITLLIVIAATSGGIVLAIILILLIKIHYEEIRKWLLKCFTCFRVQKKEVDNNRNSLSILLDSYSFANQYARDPLGKQLSNRSSVFSSDSHASDSDNFPAGNFMEHDQAISVPWEVTPYQVQPTQDVDFGWKFNRKGLPIFKSLSRQRPSSLPTSPLQAKRLDKLRKAKSVAFANDSPIHTISGKKTQRAISMLNMHSLPLKVEGIKRRDRPRSFIELGSEDSDDYYHRPASDSDISLFQPELYDKSRRGTIGAGDLGKVFCSFRYRDKTKRTLHLTLHKIIELQALSSNIQGICVNITLLPERESVFHTKQQQVQASLIFDENFEFPSVPFDEDFESKTVSFVLTCVEKASKQTPYGEARMPLLSGEIYSQISTERCLNIAPVSQKVSHYTCYNDFLSRCLLSRENLNSVFSA